MLAITRPKARSCPRRGPEPRAPAFFPSPLHEAGEVQVTGLSRSSLATTRVSVWWARRASRAAVRAGRPDSALPLALGVYVDRGSAYALGPRHSTFKSALLRPAHASCQRGLTGRGIQLTPHTAPILRIEKFIRLWFHVRPSDQLSMPLMEVESVQLNVSLLVLLSKRSAKGQTRGEFPLETRGPYLDCYNNWTLGHFSCRYVQCRHKREGLEPR